MMRWLCLFLWARVACAFQSNELCGENGLWSLLTGQCRAEIKPVSVVSRSSNDTGAGGKVKAICPRIFPFEDGSKTCSPASLSSEARRGRGREVVSSSTKLAPLVILSPDEFKNQVLERHNTADSKIPDLLDSGDTPPSNGNASGPSGEERAVDVVTEEDSSVMIAPDTDEGFPNKTELVEGTEGNSEEYHEDDEHVQTGRFNYASFDAGAVIMASSESFKSTSNLLTENRDKYSLAPCKSKKWVVVGLSEDILVDTIVIANFERYSSTVRQFLVLGSHQYPASEWSLLGKFEAGPEFGEQTFVLPQKVWARYLKFRFVTHYEDEFYCTLTVIRVFGSTHIESIRQEIEESSKSMERIKSVAGQASIEANGNGTSEGSYSQLASSPPTQSSANETADEPVADSFEPVQTETAAKVEASKTSVETAESTPSTAEVAVSTATCTAEDTEHEKSFVFHADQNASEVNRWLSSLRITRLSTCSENYTMISENLNAGGDSSPRAYLCARFANRSSFEEAATEGSNKAKGHNQATSAAIQEVRVTESSSTCPQNFLTAGVLTQNVSICYRRASIEEMKSGAAKGFAYFALRNSSSPNGHCSFCGSVSLFFCAGVVEAEDSEKTMKEVTKYGENATQESEEQIIAAGDGEETFKLEGKTYGGEAKSTSASPPTVPGGSVESIFKTLTSKVLQLELDQSLLKQYVESVVQKYANVFTELQEGLDRAAEEQDKLASVVASNNLQFQELERLREAIGEEQLARMRLEEELNVWRNVSSQTQQMLGDMAILLLFSIFISCGALTVALRKSCK